MDSFNQPVRPNNHLAMTIVATVLSLVSCTLLGIIPGIIGIVFSSQVNSKYDAQDFEGAERAASNAKIFWIVSIVLTVVIFIASFAFYGFMFSEIFDSEEFRKAIEEAQNQ